MKVLLISGKSASGKDQLAQYIKELLEQQNKRVLTIHFADPIKHFLRDYYDWDGKKDERGRYLMQHLGTDTVRKQFPNYWAVIVSKFIAATQEDWDYVLIPDLRFPNEKYIVEKYNDDVINIRINRLNEDGTYYINPNITEAQSQHPSECAMDNYAFDYMVDNSGDLADLAKNAIELVKEIV